jgi:hypothetical protein
MGRSHDILGISVDATRDEIKTAFRTLAIIYHPDKNSDPDARFTFININNAFKHLYHGENECKEAKRDDTVTTDTSSQLVEYIVITINKILNATNDMLILMCKQENIVFNNSTKKEMIVQLLKQYDFLISTSHINKKVSDENIIYLCMALDIEPSVTRDKNIASLMTFFKVGSVIDQKEEITLETVLANKASASTLRSFCDKLNISSTGAKDVIFNRLQSHFKKPKIKITLDMLINDNITITTLNKYCSIFGILPDKNKDVIKHKLIAHVLAGILSENPSSSILKDTCKKLNIEYHYNKHEIKSFLKDHINNNDDCNITLSMLTNCDIDKLQEYCVQCDISLKVKKERLINLLTKAYNIN